MFGVAAVLLLVSSSQNKKGDDFEFEMKVTFENIIETVASCIWYGF